jgi:hypothetical protein
MSLSIETNENVLNGEKAEFFKLNVMVNFVVGSKDGERKQFYLACLACKKKV